MSASTSKRPATSPPSNSPSSKRPCHDSVDLPVNLVNKLDADVLDLAKLLPPRDLSLANAAYLLAFVVDTAKHVESLNLNKEFASVLSCRKLIEDDIEDDSLVLKQLKKAWEEQKFTNIRNLNVLQLPPTRRDVAPIKSSAEQQASEKKQYAAILNSWQAPYQPRAKTAFLSTINHYYRDPTNTYANHIAVVQSSGTGKSRMLLEVTREIFGIIMNFGDKRGHPQGDDAVRQYLVQPQERSEAEEHAYSFFIALFDHLSGIIATSAFETPDDLANYFGYGNPEPKDLQESCREAFFEKVVGQARKMQVVQGPPATPVKAGQVTPQVILQLPNGKTRTLNDAAHDLNLILSNLKFRSAHNIKFILGFDEASELTPSFPDGTWSAFTIIRKVLRSLRVYPIFSVFMSTTGSVRQFHPQLADEISPRIQDGRLKLWPPFTLLGYDQLAIKLKIGDGLDQATEPRFMLSLGRPLFKTRYDNGSKEIKNSIIAFAMTKLQAAGNKNAQNIAPLAIRLPLTFNSLTTHGIQLEQCQVESYMRICLKIEPDADAMYTIAPSEPALVEAAAILMQKQDGTALDSVTIFANFLSDRLLSKGDRGELACMLLMILAHDKACRNIHTDNLMPHHTPLQLTDFLCNLFSNEWHQNILDTCPPVGGDRLADTFAKSWIHFTHFIKVRDYKVVNCDFLWRVMARGAAILCADNQIGIDAVIPVCYDGRSLSSENMTAILIQSKNVDGLTDVHMQSPLFGNMDPKVVGIFAKETRKQLPVIKIIMSVAVMQPSVKCFPGHRQSHRSTRQKKPLPAISPSHYEIFAAALSSRTFKPILASKEKAWQTLVARTGIEDLCPIEPQSGVVDTIQEMTPCAEFNDGHWENFLEL